MKILCCSLVCLFSAVSLAQSPGWQMSANPKAVIGAVDQSINWSAIKCSGTVTKNGTVTQTDFYPQSVKSIINDTKDVLVRDDGTQPLILLKNEVDESQTQYHYSTSTYVTTSADKKTVAKMDLHQTVTTKRMENVGTLDQPDQQMVPVVVKEIVGVCQ